MTASYTELVSCALSEHDKDLHVCSGTERSVVLTLCLRVPLTCSPRDTPSQPGVDRLTENCSPAQTPIARTRVMAPTSGVTGCQLPSSFFTLASSFFFLITQLYILTWLGKYKRKKRITTSQSVVHVFLKY